MTERGVLSCAIAGCGGAAGTVYWGFALCDGCLDSAADVVDLVHNVREMERALMNCLEFEERNPGRFGFCDGCIRPRAVLAARRRYGARWLHVLEAALTERAG